MIETLWALIIIACVVLIFSIIYWSIYDYYVPDSPNLDTIEFKDNDL